MLDARVTASYFAGFNDMGKEIYRKYNYRVDENTPDEDLLECLNAMATLSSWPLSEQTHTITRDL